jgi:hypothetical protein
MTKVDGAERLRWVFSHHYLVYLACLALFMMLGSVTSSIAVNSADSSIDVSRSAAPSFLGYDRNVYPGDAALVHLRQTFSFTGYWLNAPPSAKTDTWLGNRALLRERGFGFLVLFNGRLDAELNTGDPGALGRSDARTATSAARREGFPTGTILFLDQEEGGRLLAEQRVYLYAWADGLIGGGYRAGVYCSGISAEKENGDPIVTAEDIRNNSGHRDITFWVYNDYVPPSPGCVFPKHPLPPSRSGLRFASVWQFAQSPGRGRASQQFGYDRDGNCYAPGFAGRQRIHVDIDSATSTDPSHGRG